MAWQKHGLILDAAGSAPWRASHTAVPTPLLLDDRIRLYFCSRNAEGKSLPGFADFDRRDPTKLLSLHADPILPLGKPGCFDDDGIMPSCVVARDGAHWLYYIGWNRGVTVPYRNASGLAVSEDGGTTFRRRYEGPLLDRALDEPYIAVTPWLLPKPGGWHLWYATGRDWVQTGGAQEPVYHINYADSADGIHWQRGNRIAIPPAHAQEANVRPSVIVRDGHFHMWFAYRGSHDFRDGANSYRIGYAASQDGLAWTRRDDLSGIAPAAEGWDAGMITYPALLEADGHLWMFYNGSGFGKTGIGLAQWKGPLPCAL